MSLSAMNGQLFLLNKLLKETPKNLKTATDAFETQASNPDTLHFENPDALHYQPNDLKRATGGGGIENKPASMFASFFQGHGAYVGIIGAAKREIDKHIQEAKKDFHDGVNDTKDAILDHFDKHELALLDLLKYIETRASRGYEGSTVLLHVINVLKDLNKSRDLGDAKRMKELQDQLREWLRIINDYLIGPANTHGPLDLGRLLSNFTSATSTGNAP